MAISEGPMSNGDRPARPACCRVRDAQARRPGLDRPRPPSGRASLVNRERFRFSAARFPSPGPRSRSRVQGLRGGHPDGHTATRRSHEPDELRCPSSRPPRQSPWTADDPSCPPAKAPDRPVQVPERPVSSPHRRPVRANAPIAHPANEGLGLGRSLRQTRAGRPVGVRRLRRISAPVTVRPDYRTKYLKE